MYPPARLEKIISEIPGLSGAKWRSSGKTEDGFRDIIAIITSGRKEAQMKSLMDSFSRHSAIEKAKPVFEVAPDCEVMLDNLFYVSVSSKSNPSALDFLNAQYGAKVIRSHDYRIVGKVGYEILGQTESDMDLLRMCNAYAASSITLGASPNFIPLQSGALSETPADPYYADESTNPPYRWALEQVRAPEAWGIVKSDPSIVISILDRGVKMDHEDLSEAMVPGVNLLVFPPSEDAFAGEPTGHGTMCAGIAGAVTSNSLGIASLSWGASIMPVKCADAVTNLQNFPAGINWAVTNGSKILSISYNAVDTLALRDSIKAAKAAGCVIVAAAGNYGSQYGDGAYVYPAIFREVICVNGSRYSTQDTETIWDDCDVRKRGIYPDWSSSFGSQLDVMAPGEFIATTTVDNPDTLEEEKYNLNWGRTSACAPQVAALAALVLTVDPSLTPSQVQAIIQFSAKDCEYSVPYEYHTEIAESGRDLFTGYGRIDAYEAVIMAGIPRMEFACEDTQAGAIKKTSIDSKGNLVADDDVHTNATSSELQAQISDVYVVRDSSSNVIMRIGWTKVDDANDPDDDTWVSRVYLKGDLYERQGNLSPDSTASFVYSNALADVVAFLDASGNLRIRGNAFLSKRIFSGEALIEENGPDRLSSQGSDPASIGGS